MDKLVSVIMSTYNEEPEWIRESVESILDQTFKNFEFIIVLDNPDNYVVNEMVVKYSIKDPRINVIKNDKNLGITASLNSALDLAKGYYIARMDADDISDVDRLDKQIDYIRENNLDFIFAPVRKINEKHKIESYSANQELSSQAVKTLIKSRNVSIHPTWLLKKSVYQRLGGYRQVPFCEDYDFLLRSVLSGFKIGRMSQFLLSYRLRDSSISMENRIAQFYIAIGLRKLYRRKKLGDIEALGKIIKRSKEYSNSLTTEEFSHGINLVHLGKVDIKNKKFWKGLNNIFRGFSVSPLVVHNYADRLRSAATDYGLARGSYFNEKTKD